MNLKEIKYKYKSKKERRKIERAKLLKLGQENYFYPTTGINIFHCDGFVNGKNGRATSGGYTVYKNGAMHCYSNEENLNGFTSNEAEFLGVLSCLRDANVGDQIVTDSMVALSWVRSGSPRARRDLKKYTYEAHRLLHIKRVNLYWNSRDVNLAGRYNEFGI